MALLRSGGEHLSRRCDFVEDVSEWFDSDARSVGNAKASVFEHERSGDVLREVAV
jgi:hypothetical protein